MLGWLMSPSFPAQTKRNTFLQFPETPEDSCDLTAARRVEVLVDPSPGARGYLTRRVRGIQ